MIEAANNPTPSQKKPARAAAKKAPSPKLTLDDLSSDAHHLYALLDVATTKLIEEIDVDPSKPDVIYNQVISLFWIAREVSQKLAADIESQV